MAGNLKEMLLAIRIVNNDLTFYNRVVAPTLKIRRMTVADHYLCNPSASRWSCIRPKGQSWSSLIRAALILTCARYFSGVPSVCHARCMTLIFVATEGPSVRNLHSSLT